MVMLISFFRIRYCQARMVAYVNGELPPAARRRIARYIERYPECYAEYIRQRDAARDLRAKLPTIGQPDQSTLDRMWMAIQSDFTPQVPPRSISGQFRRPQTHSLIAEAPFKLRYGLVGLSMAFALVLPFTFGGTHGVFALSLSQPAPLTATAQPSDTSTPALIGMLIPGKQVDVTPPAPALPQATAVSTES